MRTTPADEKVEHVSSTKELQNILSKISINDVSLILRTRCFVNTLYAHFFTIIHQIYMKNTQQDWSTLR